jgi:LysR family transcriptional regulator, regulator for metE and metH
VKLGIELAFDVATGRGDHPERTALKADMVTRWKRPNPLIHALCGQGLLSCWESGRGFGSVFPTNKTKRPLAGRFVLLCASVRERTAPVRLSEVQWTSLGRATAGRAVAALPRWLVAEYSARLPIVAVQLGARGIAKQIFLGTRDTDIDVDYLNAFIDLARALPQTKSSQKTPLRKSASPKSAPRIQKR